jgi:hypothetical protein
MTDRLGGTEPSEGSRPTEAQLVVPRTGNRGLLVGAALTAVVLVLAVLKPWGAPVGTGQAADAGLPSGGPAAGPASPGLTPTPSATPPGIGMPGGQCFPGTDWRLFALEDSDGRRLQHWLSIEPGPATGPRDPAVPFVPVVTDRLLALGFCVGSGPDGPDPLVGVRAWALASSSRSPAVPIVLDPLAAYLPHEPNLGAVYRPPPGSTGTAGAAWPPGRYVFAVLQGAPEGDKWWFGVDVVPRPGASDAPRASATP